jgi:putative transposase
VAIDQLAPVVGVASACRAVGRPRSTWYRRHRRSPTPPRPSRPVPRSQPRALSPAERQQVLDVLHAERFWDQAPAEVYATLLDEAVLVAALTCTRRGADPPSAAELRGRIPSGLGEEDPRGKHRS